MEVVGWIIVIIICIVGAYACGDSVGYQRGFHTAWYELTGIWKGTGKKPEKKKTCYHENVIAECDNCGARLLYTPLAEVNALRTENARLQGIETAAIKQSEEVQKNWLSPVEAAGLRAEIARLTAANKWVSVKVALPDNYQKILFYSQDGDIIKGMYRYELWFFDTGWEYENSPVTHWCLLPTPPTGGE